MFASLFNLFTTEERSAQPVLPQHSRDSFCSADAMLPAPAPAFTIPARSTGARPASEANAVDLFFGVTARRDANGNTDSRHDERPAASSVSSITKELPPAYIYPVGATVNEFGEEELPSYAQSASADWERGDGEEREPVTLAQYLFKFGFLCPLLWFLSFIILLSPLSAPADWESNKTPAQRARMLQRMRASEVRWARRSLLAATLLTAVIAAIVVIVVLVKHSTH
ncbi:hypothetical protein PENSPDRAFT_653286 [Peniophora sp. CONT]|nr:hypothetical protein PENSPDRAFT_653286 [Peniophora sp. CONT]